MLSSSPPKICEPLAVGVSPRPTDRRQRQELRNTRARSTAVKRLFRTPSAAAPWRDSFQPSC